MKDVKIKICGITSTIEASYLNDNSIDYCGMVFYDRSKRCVTLDEAKDIIAALRSDITSVAVMVSPTISEYELVEEVFDIVQIHGILREEIVMAATKPIWLAINFTDEELSGKVKWLKSLPQAQYDKITGIVIDSKNFGSGRAFDWQKGKKALDDEILRDKEFILAGGINSANVREAISTLSPDVIDVSSGVERDVKTRGKDKRLIEELAGIIRGGII